MKKTCICGANLHIRWNNISYCKVCGSKYTKDGELLISRHNWNVNEFFSAIARKSEKDQRMKHQHLDQL